MNRTPENAKGNLMTILAKGRIIFNNLPLTGEEIHSLQSDVFLLFGLAKDNAENKAPVKLVPQPDPQDDKAKHKQALDSAEAPKCSGW